MYRHERFTSDQLTWLVTLSTVVSAACAVVAIVLGFHAHTVSSHENIIKACVTSGGSWEIDPALNNSNNTGDPFWTTDFNDQACIRKDS